MHMRDQHFIAAVKIRACQHSVLAQLFGQFDARAQQHLFRHIAEIFQVAQVFIITFVQCVDAFVFDHLNARLLALEYFDQRSQALF
jgi:hypothetical protein